MKKALAFCSIILFIVMLLSAMSVLMVSAEETNELDYSKIGFWTFRTDSQRETPSDEKELEEIFAYITSYQVVPREGMYITIYTRDVFERLHSEYVVFPYGELTLSYLKQLAAEPSVEFFQVGHASLPVDAGDGGADAVIILCTAVAALTVFVILRKNRMPF